MLDREEILNHHIPLVLGAGHCLPEDVPGLADNDTVEQVAIENGVSVGSVCDIFYSSEEVFFREEGVAVVGV